MRPTSNGESQASARRSSRTSAATRGRWTLTTTSSPVTRRAACTCAIDAAASGSGANSEKTASSGRPRSCSTTARTSANRSGGTWSRSCLNSDDELVGEEPLERRDDLTELHVRRPESLEARGGAAGPGPPASRASLAPAPTRRPSATPTSATTPDEATDGREPAAGEQPGNLGPGAAPGSGRAGRATPGSARSTTHGPVVGEGVLGDVGARDSRCTQTVGRDGHAVLAGDPCSVLTFD